MVARNYTLEFGFLMYKTCFVEKMGKPDTTLNMTQTLLDFSILKLGRFMLY